MIQGGDVVNKDGTGRPWSALGTPMFEDEVFAVNHTVAGFVSMANSGPDTNACQFFITVGGAPWLDGKNVAFGKVKFRIYSEGEGQNQSLELLLLMMYGTVVAGMDVVYAVTDIKTDWNDKPHEDVVVVDSGLLPLSGHYEIPEDPYEELNIKWLQIFPVDNARKVVLSNGNGCSHGSSSADAPQGQH
ncbi:unnamed protein product, partial [Notodromas monacha]